jgi:glycosyltransferase involved in cell wall biosynthesis
MTARKAVAPARVAMVVAHPDRHNRRAALMARSLAEAGHDVTLFTSADAPRPGVLPESVRTVACLAPDVDEVSVPGPEAFAGVDLDGARVVQVAGRTALGGLAGRVPEGSRLVYDVPGADLVPEAAADARGAGPRGWIKGLKSRVGEWLSATRVDAVLCPGYVFGEFLQRELKLHRVPVVPIYAAHPFAEAIRPKVPAVLRPGRPAVALVGPDHAPLGPVLEAALRVRELDVVAINGNSLGGAAPETAWDEAAAGRMKGRLHRLAVPEADLVSTLAAFQAGLVLPADTSQRSLYDLPDALFGFVMAGVPLVASNLPGIERLIWSHNIGTSVDPGDVEQMADALGRTCLDAAYRERLLHNIGIVRRKRYSWEAQETRLLDLYDLLLGPGP